MAPMARRKSDETVETRGIEGEREYGGYGTDSAVERKREGIEGGKKRRMV